MGLLLIFFLLGCHSPTDNLSIEPFIEFRNFELFKSKDGKDSLAFLSILVKDGDGDLGLSESDTLHPFNPGSQYYYNFYVIIHEKINGAWQPLLEGYNGRFPILREGLPKKPIEAIITMEMDVSYWKLFLQSYTIRMDIFIFDRALHQSNIVSSGEYHLAL
ncbi:MAG: hypothetical protein N2Z72_08010 [Bacteroidales bacterium]|nr:hypothetical protein [Bacteroidales bacterium]